MSVRIHLHRLCSSLTSWQSASAASLMRSNSNFSSLALKHYIHKPQRSNTRARHPSLRHNSKQFNHIRTSHYQNRHLALVLSITALPHKSLQVLSTLETPRRLSISPAKLLTFHKTHSMSPSQNNRIVTDDPNAMDSMEQMQFQESTKVPNEILDHVFAQVPVEYMVRLRTISKARKNFIDKIGFHIDPVFMRNTHDKSGDQLPFYPAHTSIRVNPVVDNERHLATDLRCPDLEVRLADYARDPWSMPKCQQDHAGIFRH
jgi:hypothetical protein